jgi:hypothetical protein
MNIVKQLFPVAIASFVLANAAVAEPIKLHPENPHYFLFARKPAVLITSGEHYGAVLNVDFDYHKYLKTLASDGLNLTRTFSGAYVEPSGAFNIARNTLAPVASRFICPWARSDKPGYPNGGNKFDLSRWDEKYFARLKDFMQAAAEAGVVVEMNLFCPFYEEAQWNLSPQNARNNINGIGAIARTDAYTLDKNGKLLKIQEDLTRKIVAELNSFDNLYFEICNEPYFGGVAIEWQKHIAEVIKETEKGLPKQHLISQNIANGAANIENPIPAVSIFNFHYAYPPNTIAMNYGLNKPIGDNETGFRGTNNLAYRAEAWAFLMAGGGLYNNLDYSFVAGKEDGTFVYPSSQPGGGNPQFRSELKVLKTFMADLDYIHMKPIESVARSISRSDLQAYSLAKGNETYALYLAPKDPKKEHESDESATIDLGVPKGTYEVKWVDVLTGKSLQSDHLSLGEQSKLKSPPFKSDIALKITKAK